MKITKILPLVACFLLVLGIGARAESIEPDLRRAIRDAQKPKVYYGPARVGWNASEKATAGPAANPIYESLRLDSPTAVRKQLKSILLPDWQVILAFMALIFGIRMLRNIQRPAGSSAPEAPANVIPFPSHPLPREEAA
jgi:hypothetical protein